jgi:hypothetical protein
MFRSSLARGTRPSPSTRPRKPATHRPILCQLEDRWNPTFLFVDFGDAFPQGGLTDTLSAFQNTKSGTNPSVNGPDLSFITGSNSSSLTILPYNGVFGTKASANRAAIMQIVRRYYEPFDVTVVELTNTPQTVNGFSIKAATSLADVSKTLGLNEGGAKNNDSYSFVGVGILDGFDLFGDFGLAGIAGGTDLNNKSNLSDDLNLNFVSPNFQLGNVYDADTIAHENGHNFGLRHVHFTGGFNIPGQNWRLLSNAETMSYNRASAGSSDALTFLSRFPTVLGDGNTDPNTLSTPQGQGPYVQLQLDPNVGANPAFHYVTGTGANDIITITKTGANAATVKVQPFNNNTYTSTLIVPGGKATSFSYTIPLDKPIQVYGGPSDDRFVIDNDLGTTVTFFGMAGTDSLVVTDAAGAITRFDVGSNTAASPDTSPDFRATLTFGKTTVNLIEQEKTSLVTVTNAGAVTYVTPGGVDNVTATGLAGGGVTISGTVVGTGKNALAAVSLTLPNAKSLAFNLGNNDGTGANDTLTMNFAAGSPIPVGGVTYDGGTGADAIAVSADANFTLTDAKLVMSGLGSVSLANVESATLTGGASANLFTLTGWSGSAVVDGGSGTDKIVYAQDSDITLVPTQLTTSLGSVIQLASLEVAQLTGGASDNVFDLSAWLGSATVDGLDGSDTLRLTRDADFVAADALISVSDGTSYPIANVENVALIGGAGNNLFDMNAWSGGGSLDGKGGTDEVRVTRDADMTLAAASLTISVGLPLTIANTENAALTGGGGGNTFVLDQWQGNATLDGLDGADTYTITPGTAASLVDVTDSGTGPNAVAILGTAAADFYDIEPNAVVSGLQRVQYANVQSVLIDGREGDDTFVSSINLGFFAGGPFTLEGGTGLNTFAITGTPAATIKQSGVRFTGGATGQIILDPDGSVTPSLSGPLTGDETIYDFNNMSKIGDVTPADRFDFTFTGAADAIAVTDGPAFAGNPTIQAFNGTVGVAVARKARVVVTGGGGTDSFTVGATAAVTGITAIDLVGGPAADTFAVTASKLPLNLIGGGANDSFTLGGPAGLDAITAAVTVDGGTGSNAVALNDAGSAAANASVGISPTGVTGLTGTGASAVTFAAGTVSGLDVTGAANFANAVAVGTLGFPLTLTTGSKADTVTLAAVGAAAAVLTGDGADTVRVNGLSAGLSLQTQDGDDAVSFNAPTTATPGTLDGFTSPIAFDAGAGTDAVTFNDAADGTGNAYAISPTGFTRSGGVSLAFAAVESATVFGGGTGDNTYAVTGLSNGVAVTDGSGNGTMTIAGNTLAGTNAFAGGAGGDAFLFTGDGLAAPVTIDGGADSDSATARGTAGDDTIAANVAAAGNGTLTGAGANALTFTGLESLTVDALAGTNTLTYADATGGNATATYAPTGPAAGTVAATGTTAVSFANANGAFTYNGGPQADSLTVLGVSTTGAGTGAEATATNGIDTVTISDTLVAITNASLGVMRSVVIATNAGLPTAGTLIVRTGSEFANPADVVNVTPSNRTNIYVYGGGPTALPGDKLVVVTTGPRTISLDTDPQGKPITRVTQLSNGATVGFAEFETAPRPELVAVASGPNSPSRVQTYDASAGNLKLDFSPFGPDFRGGMSVATGDLNGDNFPDVIVAAGPGSAPVVNVYDGITGGLLASFLAYAPSFTGGVQVAAGDVNGDGKVDIVIGSGIGGGPHVQAVSGADFSTRLANFFAYDPSFRNGVQVAAGDLDGDGKAEIVTGAGPGGGPHVRAFHGTTGAELANFFAFDPNFRGGVNVAVADVTGDNVADIIAAPGSGGSTNVYLYTPTGSLQATFNAATVNGQVTPFAREDGVRLSTADLDGDGVRDLVTARGRGTLPVVTGIKLNAGAPQVIRTQDVFDPSFTGGVFVG